MKLVLDAGHGGSDPGAKGYGLQEKNLTLAIVHNIKSLLQQEYEGLDIVLTRSDDTFISLTNRCAIANRWGADFFLSVHINASGASGFESFVWDGETGPTTKAYQNAIHEAIYNEAYISFPNRGKKASNFAVLRETYMPAILTENLFIDNAKDAEQLKDPFFIERVARGHVIGLANAFGFKLKEKPVVPVVDGPFLDVPANHWAAEDIAWVKAQGYMLGYEGSFAPNAAVTRAEMAVILRRAKS